MPTIEFVCVGQKEPLDFSEAPFAVRGENKVISHRKLFAADFAAVQGCIYHLAGPRKKEGKGFFFAGDLLDNYTHSSHRVFFHRRFIPDIEALLRTLLDASPSGQILFSTDYQSGPKSRRYTRPQTLEEFWRLHDAHRIHLNALYVLCNSVSE